MAKPIPNPDSATALELVVIGNVLGDQPGGYTVPELVARCGLDTPRIVFLLRVLALKGEAQQTTAKRVSSDAPGPWPVWKPLP